MRSCDYYPHMKVRVTRLLDTRGWAPAPYLLRQDSAGQPSIDVRRQGVTGNTICMCPGHGWDVVVEHDGSSELGVYSFAELEPV